MSGVGGEDGTAAESSLETSQSATRQPLLSYGRLTRESLEAHSAAQDDSAMSLYPYGSGEAGPSRRKEASPAPRLRGKGERQTDRMHSAESTSSEESDAGAEDDERDELALAQEVAEEEEFRRELSAGEGSLATWQYRGKGKGKEGDAPMGAGSVASTLPAEILIQVSTSWPASVGSCELLTPVDLPPAGPAAGYHQRHARQQRLVPLCLPPHLATTHFHGHRAVLRVHAHRCATTA